MKEVLAGAGVPTAEHAAFRADQEDEALSFLGTLDGLYVVKTDGLAAGKGVFVTESDGPTRATRCAATSTGEAFGDAGRHGRDRGGPPTAPSSRCSSSATATPTPRWRSRRAQDFKRIGDGDTGPNTGGMGAYSPVAGRRPRARRPGRWRSPCGRPSHALAARGAPYRGVLYAGSDAHRATGRRCIEYNVRFGDPECQVVVPRLVSDLGELCRAAAQPARRCPSRVRTTRRASPSCSPASGYPSAPAPGSTSPASTRSPTGPTSSSSTPARPAPSDGSLVTAGGRVLDVTAFGATVADARQRAYDGGVAISWPGLQYRHDIAAAA